MTTRGLILRYVTEQARQHGRIPTVREIGEQVGLRSPSTVQAHLDALVREGKLVRETGKHRTLRVPR